MKKIAILTLLTIAFPWQVGAAPLNTVGRILLQVESVGEAWYVDPVAEERFYLKDGEAAFQALRNFGLGITNDDLAKIPVGFEDRFAEIDTDGDGLGDKLEEGLGTNPNNADTDGDGFEDRAEIESNFDPTGDGLLEIDTQFSATLHGRIVLQVQERGQAWYINPVDGKRYYMSDGEAAYQIMRFLSLGITNADLETIPLRSERIDCADSTSCFIGMMETGVPAIISSSVAFNFIFDLTSDSIIDHIPQENGDFTQISESRNNTISYTPEQRQGFLDEGLSEEEINEQEAELNKDIKGTVIQTCHYAADQLETLIENFKYIHGIGDNLSFTTETDCDSTTLLIDEQLQEI